MAAFWQVLGGVLIAAVLGLMLQQQGRDLGLLLSLGACAMVAIIAVNYLSPVVEFLQTLKEAGKLDGDMLRIMLKAVGIGLVGELAALICQDAGNSALAKTVQMLTAAVILWLSLPLMQALLDMVVQIMGEV